MSGCLLCAVAEHVVTTTVRPEIQIRDVAREFGFIQRFAVSVVVDIHSSSPTASATYMDLTTGVALLYVLQNFQYFELGINVCNCVCSRV